MTEPNAPQDQPGTQGETPTPEAQPQAASYPPEEPTAGKEGAAPAEQTAAAPAPAGTPPGPGQGRGPRGKDDKGKGKGKGGGGFGFGNRRIIQAESLSPEDERRFSSSPRLKDLDDEIQAELDAALGDMSAKDMFGAEDSRQVRQQVAKAGEHGPKKGRVLSVRGKDVFVEVPGGRSQGVLPVEQFETRPEPGTEVDVSIEGYDPANGLLLLTRKGAAMVADWSSVAEGMIVEARVTETNKGGLAVDVNGLRGFMPISQVDLYRVEQPEQFVNQRLRCMVTEVRPDEKNLVLSRRALLEKEREELREKLWAELAEGQVREGVVRSVREFGAFVDLGGVDGLLHVSEMSWQRVNDPSTLVQPGQRLKVCVLKLDRESRKVGLGLKQLEASPWDDLGSRIRSLDVVSGKVTRTMDFGAFVELEPGVEGLIHVSELARGKVWRVTDVVKPGDEVEVKVLSIDIPNRRISLSLKDAQAPAPAPVPEEEPEEEVPAKKEKPSRPRTTPLRGGVGGASNLLIPPGGNEGD